MLAPMILKLTSRPFSFSIISGCPEVMWRFMATPYPAFCIATARANGTDGSLSSVKGLSPTSAF